ncbi:alpha/beta fold hydrolase [Kutzneria sp. 744]|uniref:alpha/beta fold hydrolase n=1 Tax=Kutzneria sp. (strain 744) TaxID=345341 RepID=UPI0003EEB5F7|nr:alpha/beta fold hydrolase [Kutzneria sp. 744]EWM10869.1 alpha/beta hydrolase [Kutzneria sp. 744]
MTSSLARWGGTGRYADIDGPVHYVDFGGPADGVPMVMVHGLGGSHLDFSLLAPRMTGRFRVLAPDLLGHGLTAPDHRTSTIAANTDLIDRFIRTVADRPVVLVGNSMGGLIAARQAARHPETVARLVLIDPALPLVPRSRLDVAAAMIFGRLALPLGRPILAFRRRNRTARQQVREAYDRCCVDPSRVPESLIVALVELIEHRESLPGIDDAFLASARTLLDINNARRAAWAALGDIVAPVLLIHGEQDRLVSVASAREAARRLPQWTVDVLPGLGHLPQIEAPDRVASRIHNWVG